MPTLLKRLPVLLCCLLVTGLAGVAFAQTGDDYNLGSVHFPTSGSDEAQPYFIRGVLLLHSFEYDRAAEEFRAAQRVDPDLAMAYWGEAMTYNHPLWNQQDREAAREALRRLGPTDEGRQAMAPTARERAYLAAVAVLYGEGSKSQRDTLYSQAMERLTEQYADDVEARAFYALSLLGLSQGERNHSSYMRAGAIALDISRDHPRHPGAMHYAIHSFDDPVHAPLGLPAAQAYSTIVPNAAHAQHMVSHIFVALGNWDEVVAANEKATRAVARMADFAQGSGRERWPCGHNAKWLVYGYLQQGRVSAAREVAGECRIVASEASSSRPYASVAAMHAMLVVDGSEAGKIELDTTGLWLLAKQKMLLATGLLALRNGEEAEAIVVEMESLRKEAVGDRADDASLPPLLARVEIMERVLRAQMLPDGQAALNEIRRAVALQTTLPTPYGPPPVVMPAGEALGEVVLALGHPAEAVSAFRDALERTPRRPKSVLGLARAYAEAGDAEQAAAAYRKLLEIWDEADRDLEGLTEAQQYLAASR